MDSTENGCPFCGTFVSNLEKVYHTIKQGRVPEDGYQIQWTFRDYTPFLPGLADSARECSWCLLLNRKISADFRGPRDDTTWTNNIEIIRGAIDTCVDDHQTCPGRELKTSPLRLIDVLDGDSIKLESPGNTSHIYAALSYCWGESEIDKTTRINIDARMSPFPLNTLPLTLRDAIILARHLKIRYIWIDALCIVQDCIEEWSSEAGKMMEYYQHARVTIVPVESTSADSGMGLGRWSERWSDLILSDDPSRYGSVIFESTWNKRGWTYQERLNSSRILFVSGQMLVLECRAGSLNTSDGWKLRSSNWLDFLPTSSAITDRDIRDIYNDWCEIVERYWRRRIVAAFQKASGRQIIAGLWEDKILEGIVSWATDSVDPDIHHLSLLISTSSGYSSPTWDQPPPRRLSFPTWSWLDKDSSSKWLPSFSLSRVEISSDSSSKLLRIIKSDEDIGSFKLSISGAILSKVEILGLLELVADCNGNEILCPGRGRAAAFLDIWYDKVAACSCDKKHCKGDRTSYHAICSLSPPVLALLIGTGYFRVKDRLIWHFVLIQPIHGEPLEYRRIGTMHIPNDRLNEDAKQKLSNPQQKEIILV
ncbi:heterokaryon incompatibility protein-domain-containing protein [Xylaria curta]|nr:heterokaryon incompatibility protein-domain-containing protein [Xylaria curta]